MGGCRYQHGKLYRFFENKDCKYFPCHKGLADFNCRSATAPCTAWSTAQGIPGISRKTADGSRTAQTAPSHMIRSIMIRSCRSCGRIRHRSCRWNGVGSVYGEKVVYGEKSAVRGVRCTQKTKHDDESKDCKTLPYGVQYVQTVRHYFAKIAFMLPGRQELRCPRIRVPFGHRADRCCWLVRDSAGQRSG